MRTTAFIPIFAVLLLAVASCGTDEIARVDAEYELEQRAQIDAAVADLEAIVADPARGRVAAESIDRYLRARDRAKRFNEAVAPEGEDGGSPALPLVLADDQVLDPARQAVPSLFGPTGKAIVPEDLRRFRRAVAEDLAAALRPVVADSVELLTARTRYGLDATYPDQGGMTRRELISDAASVLEPYWPDLTAELQQTLQEPG